MSVRAIWEMECPKCGSDEKLGMQVSISMTLSKDGRFIDCGSREWGYDSGCWCSACGYHGKVADFMLEHRKAEIPAPAVSAARILEIKDYASKLRQLAENGKTGPFDPAIAADCLEDLLILIGEI